MDNLKESPLFLWLKKPYYFNNSWQFKLLVSLTFGFTVFLFLIIFKPFHLGDTKYETITATGFGIVTTLVLLFNHFVLPLFFKSFFNEDSWTLGKHLLFGIACFGLISLGNWLYSSFLIHGKVYYIKINYLPYLYNTLAVGFFPTLVFLLVDERFTREKRLVKAHKITSKALANKEKLHEQIELKKNIIIYSENKRDAIELDLSKLVYINSQGNYVSFYLLNENHEIKEHVLRARLSEVEKDLSGNKNIIRCHRSYIINTKYMNKLKGNARNYYLQSSEVPFEIPVSRNYPVNELEDLIN